MLGSVRLIICYDCYFYFIIIGIASSSSSSTTSSVSAFASSSSSSSLEEIFSNEIDVQRLKKAKLL